MKNDKRNKSNLRLFHLCIVQKAIYFLKTHFCEFSYNLKIK